MGTVVSNRSECSFRAGEVERGEHAGQVQPVDVCIIVRRVAVEIRRPRPANHWIERTGDCQDRVSHASKSSRVRFIRHSKAFVGSSSAYLRVVIAGLLVTGREHDQAMQFLIDQPLSMK